jgi:hypothetical protein
MARVTGSDDVAKAVTRLAQAALRISDLWFTMRTRAVESVTDGVADILAERQLPFVRAETLPGRSGRKWTVDFHIPHPRRSALVSVLSSASRAAARANCRTRYFGTARPKPFEARARSASLSLAIRRHPGCLGSRGFPACQGVIGGCVLVEPRGAN